MLGSFVVRVRPMKSVCYQYCTGRLLHGLFLHLMERVNPSLAGELHDTKGQKPFTVSPLFGHFLTDSGAKKALEEEEYWFRFTALTEECCEALVRVFYGEAIPNATVMIEETPFLITATDLAVGGRRGWSGLLSYDDLISTANGEPEITLCFQTPTTFRQGKINYVLPDPNLVFGSLLRKWNAYAPKKIPQEIKNFIFERVGVSQYRLSSRLYDLGDHSLIGFQGKCKYTVLGDQNEMTRYLNILADFAFFAGLGQKTTMGMGQVRRLG
ncbi:CRISPR-associated endoribonuclease Cas6 [Candidatus Hakubella thermalkaliphila]|uniref:CRISPR-associated endoribonuclease Cas6 n=2 Tax=Candidatus Hakubella thermalkaliphila TaxID=2754717 RepID=A0A6V8P4X2_9ACTN|nr:CRISPR-associated endoribonuclease Cas6 [Candidatus Hakubella thermalkaliphila]GFP27363.1 CRISPR-associated endoribonuclease Cas6 [Candidatus Hakubella thermalkaliphila]